MENNNAIYRYLRTAYGLKSDDLAALWADAGYIESYRTVTRYFLDDNNPEFKKLATRRLKAWLAALLTRLNIPLPGIQVQAMVSLLASVEGIQSTGDPVADALAIRDKRQADRQD